MAMNGLMANAKPFETETDAGERGCRLIEAIASGEIDAGVLWGPLGGYYAQSGRTCRFALVPLVKEKAGPAPSTASPWACTRNEPEWKHRLDELIAGTKTDINAMLTKYNVPLLDENGNLITMPTAKR